MSFANFGIGMGAFSQGLNSGLQTASTLHAMKDKGDIRKAAKQGISQATQNREADISGRIEKTGLDDAQGFMGNVTTGHKVGGKSFGSEKEARGHAEKGVGTIMDYFMKDAAPKIAETYMAQGHADKAQEWQKFIEDNNTQQGMKHWAGAMRSAQMGDMDGFATALEKAYNTPGYMDDGVTVKGHEIGKDGQITMTFERDGKEFQQTFDGSEDIVQAGIGMLSPQAAFEMHQKQSQAAAEARAETAKGEVEHQRDIQLEGVKTLNKAELAEVEAEIAKRYGGTGKDAPAVVRTAQWLVQNGVADNSKDAWNLANMSKSKGRQEFAMEFAKMMGSSISGFRTKPEDRLQEGLAVYDKLQQEQSGQAGAPAPGGAPAQGGAPAAGGIPMWP